MSGFDLSKTPPPKVLENLSYEAILAEVTEKFLAQFGADEAEAASNGVPTRDQMELALTVEGSLIQKTLQAYAYHALYMRQRVNDAAKACMIAYATGADLDNLAALYGVVRNVTDPSTTPQTYESDESFRERVVLSLDGLSTAGPVNAYHFHASKVAGVKDVAITSPSPGQVLVTILGHSDDGVPDTSVLAAVDAALSHEDVRPLTDQVIVQAGSVTDYQVLAALYVPEGSDGSLILRQAEEAVQEYVSSARHLGHDIARSALYGALHQAGVINVDLIEPSSDIVMDPLQAGNCTDISVTLGVA